MVETSEGPLPEGWQTCRDLVDMPSNHWRGTASKAEASHSTRWISPIGTRYRTDRLETALSEQLPMQS